jgi:hypothetical protein
MTTTERLPKSKAFVLGKKSYGYLMRDEYARNPTNPNWKPWNYRPFGVDWKSIEGWPASRERPVTSKAFLEHMPSNPYERGTQEFVDWDAGWRFAARLATRDVEQRLADGSL